MKIHFSRNSEPSLLVGLFAGRAIKIEMITLVVQLIASMPQATNIISIPPYARLHLFSWSCFTLPDLIQKGKLRFCRAKIDKIQGCRSKININQDCRSNLKVIKSVVLN